MGMAGLLMVIDQVNIAGGIRLFGVAKNQPSVSGHSQAPQSFQVAFERMQPPARKQAELLQRLGGFEGEEKLPQLFGHLERHTLGVSVLVHLPKPLVAKADKLDLIPS
jgi:hypothetical protein